jgi:hypothetical protein
MDGKLLQIIYVSTAGPELDEHAMLDLLARSRRRNAERGITGLLLQAEGSILHVIEGSEGAISDLFSKIAKDPRHRGVHVLSRRKIGQRDFPDYRMGFKREKLKHLNGSIPGFSDFVENRSISSRGTEGKSRFVAAFLRTFARTTGLER